MASGKGQSKNGYMLVVYGGAGVGKSALTIQLVLGQFLEEYDPTIEDSYRKQILVDEEACLVDILDTAGREEFSAIRDHYTRVGDGFLLVYSVTERTSFTEMDVIRAQVVSRKEDEGPPPMVVVGNKIDLTSKRVVSTEEGKDYADSKGLTFFETSAKLIVNVEAVFFELVRQIRKALKAKPATHRRFCTLL